LLGLNHANVCLVYSDQIHGVVKQTVTVEKCDW